MSVTALQLWQRTALRPSEASDVRRPRRRSGRAEAPAGREVRRERELRRARQTYLRMRDTVASGLLLSVLLGAPVGWSFVQSTLLRQDPSVGDSCPVVASLLSPALERDVKELRASGTLSKGERHMLGMKVCDPGVRLVLEPLLRGVSDLGELRDLAKGEGTGGALASTPLAAALSW